MANVLDLRRRIRSVKNTRQITKAMKMVSAARLRRAQDRALASRPMGQMLINLLESLISRTELVNQETGEPKHPLLEHRPENNILLVLVTGDRGLAGAFNSNVLKGCTKFIQIKADKNIDIVAVGRKGRDFLRRRYPSLKPDAAERAGKVQVIDEYAGLLGKLEFEAVSEMSDHIVKQYSRGQLDSVYILFNEFKSVIAQRVIVQRLLPVQEIGRREVTQAEELTQAEKERIGEAARSAGISLKQPQPSELEQEAAKFGTRPVDYIYEQSPEELFAGIMPRYVAIELFQAMLESAAAEHAARMTAMDSATNNANEVIDSLTLNLNRVRQAAITKEIIEIVSGAAAL
jgi:F-type H+-transporting ATPase subunit gamma